MKAGSRADKGRVLGFGLCKGPGGVIRMNDDGRRFCPIIYLLVEGLYINLGNTPCTQSFLRKQPRSQRLLDRSWKPGDITGSATWISLHACRSARRAFITTPTKADLVREVVARYRAEAREGMAMLDRQLDDPAAELDAYASYWSTCIKNGTASFCICAMLAAELPAIPAEVAAEVQGHFEDLTGWLALILSGVLPAGSSVWKPARLSRRDSSWPRCMEQ